MKRLFATLWCDMRLQWRNGFYLVTGIVLAFWVIFRSQLPPTDLARLLPAFIISNLVLNTFYFVAGLLLLEKAESTLEAQVLTPLRPAEYLASKVLSLSILALVENLLVVVLFQGFAFRLLPLLTGLLLAAAMYTLTGFMVIARYDSINEFLFPSVPMIILLCLPLLPYFGVGQTALVYAHPLQPALLLMQAGFVRLPFWQAAYALLYGGLCLGLLAWASQRRFQRFIIRKEGVR
jgi:fluoroquinolone transport system permease protein